MAKLFTSLLLLLCLNCLAQSKEEHWTKWNSNYPEMNVLKLIEMEKQYADSVEKNPQIPPFYARLDKLRFNAEYTGKIRPIAKDVFQSMAQVYQLYIGDPSQLQQLVDSEALFKVGQLELWMPIQKGLLKALKKEVKPKDKVLLYTLFLNQHSSTNKLYNSFLISEFNAM